MTGRGRGRGGITQTKRVDIGLLMATEAIRVDQLQNFDLLFVFTAVGRGDYPAWAPFTAKLVELITNGA